MVQLPVWAVRLQAAWLGLGTLLTILAFQSGLPIPSFLTDLFTQGVWDVLVQAATALFTAFQVIRSIFVATPRNPGVVSLSVRDTRSFALNPFRLSV